MLTVRSRSLVGHGVTRQLSLVNAIPKTNVRLFVPSDLAARYDEQGLRIPVNHAKDEVERPARAADIPVTVVLTGNFAEFALATPQVVIFFVLRLMGRLLPNEFTQGYGSRASQ
jgi:hypothetical protein